MNRLRQSLIHSFTDSLIVLFLSAPLSHAALIAQWNFNSAPPDANTATGTTGPSSGYGTAILIGNTTATFASGGPNDPAGTDNSAWNTASYPAQTASNKLAGVQFNASTADFCDISIRWDQRLSATASKYCRLQYSADGLIFTDFPTPISASNVAVFEPHTVDLSPMPELNNNPNFAFRIVSEFESTATGSGADAYVTTFATNNYSRGGTVRFEMVTVSGTPIPGANTPPTISALSNLTLRVAQSSPPLAFTIGDAEETAEALLVLASSSDDLVVPSANLILDGSGTDRSLTLTAGLQPGTATLTLCVVDSGGKSNVTSFIVAVLPADTPPLISPISATNTLTGMAVGPIPFNVSDLESAPEDLVISAASANPALVPNSPQSLSFGGAGADRTLSITPAPGQAGVAPVTLSVSDGVNTTSTSFPVMVTPSSSVLIYDPFEYPDGSLLTNSAFLWDNRSGTYGQCQVTNHQLQITSAQTEDVVCRFPSGPCAKSNGLVLYASFRMNFQSLPKPSPGCFAHFAGGSSLRGRVYAATADAFAGGFHLFVSNGSNTAPNEFFAVLSTNTTYTVITRYDIDSATSTLWVNASSEKDIAVTATDPQSPLSITSFGFRQDTDLGATVRIHDLRVGLSFADVVPGTGPNPNRIPLSIRQLNGVVVLHWTNSTFILQTSPTPTGSFIDLPNARSPFTNTLMDSTAVFRLRFPLGP